jgi:hypothetical protein
MRRESRESWAKRVERWRDSGLSINEFAQEIGVNPNTLAGWRWRLGADARSVDKAERRRSAGPSAAQDDMKPIELVEVVQVPPPSDERFEVVTANGRTVRVPARFDDAALGRLLAAVERA